MVGFALPALSSLTGGGALTPTTSSSTGAVSGPTINVQGLDVGGGDNALIAAGAIGLAAIVGAVFIARGFR